jgi:hypothetical protein
MRRVAIIICLIVVPGLSLAQTTNIRDRDGRLIGTKHYDSTSRETQYRDRDGRLEYTGNRNGSSGTEPGVTPEVPLDLPTETRL